MNKKIIAIIFIFFIGLISLFIARPVYGASGVVRNLGNVTYNGSKVGHFEMNGQIAFCVDHAKVTPQNTPYQGDIYENPMIRKALYYGWGGVEPWSGFNGNQSKGIVITTLTLDSIMNGNNRRITRDFINFLNSKEDPKKAIDFSIKNLNTRVENNKQVSDTTEIQGSNSLEIKFTLDNDVTAVVENRNYRQIGGNLILKNGDKVHFEAPLNKDSKFTKTGIENRINFNGVIMTNQVGNSRLQRIGRWQRDPAGTTEIRVNFQLREGSLEINKKDKVTKHDLEGFEFNVKSEDGSYNRNFRTGTNGKVTINGLAPKKYIVTEVSGRNDYVIGGRNEVTIESGKTTKTVFYDMPKLNDIEITKVDSTNSNLKLENAEFELYKDNNNNGVLDNADTLAEKIVNEKNIKVGTLKTDANGFVKVSGLRLGNYILKETKAPTYYKVITRDTKIEVKENNVTKITIKNAPIEFNIEVLKVDGDTKIPLKGFEFNIYNEKTNTILKDNNGKEYKNVKTDENGKITTGKVYLKDVQNVVIKEVKAVGHYTIRKDNVKKLVLTQEEIEKNNLSKVKFENYQNFELTINKTTNANSKIRNLAAGQGIEDTYFSIYSVDNNGKIKDFAKNRAGKYLGTKTKLTFEDSSLNKEYYVFKTDKNGNVSIKELMKGNYIIREVKASKHFLNDSKDIKITLDENTSLTAPIVKFVNTPNTPNIHIEKEGLVETQPNDVIRYDFPDISNRSNVKLYNFTWEDNLPYDYVKMLKLYTGLWNEENTFKVYYKTNKIEWKELDGKDYSTLKNNFVSFENLNLDNINEYVTDFKLVFKNPVKKDFKATETPFIFVKVDSDLNDKDVFVNKTLDYGWTFDGEKVEDHAEWKTKTYKKTLKIKKLPRTGSEVNNAIYFISAMLIAGVIYFIKIK